VKIVNACPERSRAKSKGMNAHRQRPDGNLRKVQRKRGELYKM